MQSKSQFSTSSPAAFSLFFGLGAFVFALYVTMRAVTAGPMAAVTPLVVFGFAAWFFGGRSAWWLPVPLAVAFGGLFWAGFKIYMHEIAILLAILALIPMIALKVRVRGEGPARVPTVLWVLLGYLFLQCGYSMFTFYDDGMRALGHLLRSYVQALWAPAFAVLFYIYGNARHTKLVLRLIYISLLIRSAIALYQFYFPNLMFVNVFGAFFLVSPGRELDLRDSALRLVVLSFGLFTVTRSTTLRGSLVLMGLVASWLVLVGSSRVSVAMLLVIPMLYFLLRRKFIPLILAGSLIGSGLLMLNLFPSVIDDLPSYARRALSGLIVTKKLDVHATLAMSNEWHYLLMRMGLDRWLDSPVSFFFGRIMEPFDESFYSYTANLYDNVIIAAATGRYESALWTILATQGLIGLMLVIVVFYKMIRDPLVSLAQNGMKGIDDCLFFCAACHVLIYAIFAWVTGSFPGYEMVLAIMAKAAYDDRKLSEYLKAQRASAPQIKMNRRVTNMFEPV